MKIVDGESDAAQCQVSHSYADPEGGGQDPSPPPPGNDVITWDHHWPPAKRHPNGVLLAGW